MSLVATAGSVFATPAASVPPPIPSTQDPSAGPDFVGSPATAQPLPSKPVMRPQVSGVPGDSGNTKTYDGPAPHGAGTQVRSAAGDGGPVLLFPLLDGWLTAAQLDMSDAMYSAITGVDPTTMAVKASWSVRSR
ncbi:hypothetical protein [Streptomyces fuscichromogenes]|uniref:hypothetical protein n=1 Tax=Streptomyces fuscichromogenes TaxID=1324013 RepID=UPI001670AB56|nr:hypothetical protein [Streptomyces fuscichromogenes]